MRKILFRGKRSDNGEWAYGFYVLFGGKNIIMLSDTTELRPSEIFGLNELYEYPVIHEAVPDTVGQFTGLLDKNGNKIFEGDIVRDLSVYSVHEGFLKRGIETLEQIEKYRYNGAQACVEFCTENVASCGCCYPDFVGSGFKAQFVDLTCCEVIGNKWDNPELLEGGVE